MMNKYWKSIAIIMVIALGIGTFYIYQALQGSQSPAFAIHKISGDTDAIKPVTVQGQIMGDSFLSDTVKITEEGSTYDRDRSYISMNSINESGVVKQLQKEHRNFMRGKYNRTSLYEDDKMLGYADIDIDYSNVTSQQEFQFKVSTLNKDDNEKSTFTADVPDEKNLNSIYVEDVQVKDDVLYILTSNDMFEDGENTMETHAYQFDIDTKKLLQDETLVSATVEQNVSVNVSLLPEVDVKGKHEYAVFHHIESNEYWGQDGRRSEGNDDVKSSELVAYDFSTNETKTLQMPGEIQDIENMEMIFDGRTVYVMNVSDATLTVYLYDVKTESIEDQFTTDIPDVKNEPESDMAEAANLNADYDNTPILEIKNETLYILKGHGLNADVMVMDLKSGDILYDGAVELQDGEDNADTEFNLDLYRLQIE